MPRTIIDAGGCTYVAICTGCGARTLPAMSREEALHEARHHERRAHPGDDQTANALTEQRRRDAAKQANTPPGSFSVGSTAQSHQREPDAPSRSRRRAAAPL